MIDNYTFGKIWKVGQDFDLNGKVCRHIYTGWHMHWMTHTLDVSSSVSSQEYAIAVNLYNFRAERCRAAPANRIFSGPITAVFNAMCFDENPFTCRCEKRRQKGLRVSNVALLLVVFKWHHGSEGVKIDSFVLRLDCTTLPGNRFWLLHGCASLTSNARACSRWFRILLASGTEQGKENLP